MIGWYVHAQGSGHLQRMQCITGQLRTPVTVLSSLPPPPGFAQPWVRLADDVPLGDDLDATAGGTLHWAPRHHVGLRERMATIASWVSAAAPRLMVVDVSVEVAVLVRSMGIPVVVVAMRGDRRDRPHTTAYDLADALLAPWNGDLAEPWPAQWLTKTWHVGALSRYDGLPITPHRRSRRVTALWGSGGSGVGADAIGQAASTTPGWEWTAVGLPGSPWVSDVWSALLDAEVVVTHGGQNALAEVAAARRPAVVVPQERPHGEQRATAAVLAREGLALVRHQWPAPKDWPLVLDEASALDPSRWARWSDGMAARRAAAHLDEAVECASR